MVIGAARLGAGSPSNGSTPVFAGAAPRQFVEALRVAVEARGWILEKIVPAQAAWLSSLRKARSPGSGKPSSGHDRTVQLIVGVDGGAAHLVRVSGETPDMLRRLPASDTEAILLAAGPSVGRALLLAEGDSLSDLAAGLKNAGWVLIQPEAIRSPAVVAAREAGDAPLELVPDFLERTRREKGRGVTMRLLAGAMVILAAAAVVNLWGTARRLEEIRDERAQLSSAVAPVLAMRDSIDQIDEHLGELQLLGGQSRRWTSSLIELTELLPPETHLVSLRAAGDTVLIEASGGRAGEALAAMGASQLLKDVQLEGSIERELEDGSTLGERFTLNAILAAPAEAPGRAALNHDR
jgi:Tfp pilus assembly protein PilN